MSTNAPQVQRPQNDPWMPRRLHGGLRHLRRVGRGKNRHYQFQGQLDGEVVKLVIRRHIFFLITPALPLITSILAFLGVVVLSNLYPGAGAFWTFLELVAGAAILATAIYFIYKDLILWWLETYIITNKRILEWKGLVTPSREEVPLENVQQVAIDQPSLLSMILSYGDVHLYLVGGKGLLMQHIPNPKKVRDSLQQITVQAKEAKASAPKPQIPPDLDWRGVLAILAKGEELPKLPNPDQKYRQRPGDLRRPLRTFGGPLRIPCDVHYTTDEETVLYVQRSKYILALRLSLPILVLLATIVLTLYFPHLLLYTALAILAILLWIGLTIINYVDDVFIFTNRRIIDIERKYIFFYEEHDEAEYSKIKDIRVIVGNPLFLSLDVGTVFVETPGSSPDIILSFVDHPFFLQDRIYALKNFKEKIIDKVKEKNTRKEELNTWFGDVLGALEKKVVSRGVPNLQKLDLFAAAQRAREFGMKVVPVGEDASYPNIESGLIVAQNPLPGTLMHVDSNNPEERPLIQVVLSKRP